MGDCPSPNQGAVVIHIPDSVAHLVDPLAGNISLLDNRPSELWHDSSVQFLNELSRRLMPQAIKHGLSDVVGLAYWLRASNLIRIKSQYQFKPFGLRKGGPSVVSPFLRMGLGLVFHICPSNVPVNFAYSMAFALLAGNTSIVRLSSIESPSSDYIIRVLVKLLDLPEFRDMQKRMLFIRFEHNDVLNAFFSSIADGRVIWGGNGTVQHMRTFPIPAHAREITFSDRYSLSVLSAEALNGLERPSLQKFTQQLFNDMILMDQAACSSPQLFCWLGEPAIVSIAQERLWLALADLVRKKKVLTPIAQMNKFVNACSSAIETPELQTVRSVEGILTRLELNQFLSQQDVLRGYYGTAIEIHLQNLKQLVSIVNESYQTITYFGIDALEIKQLVVDHSLRGIDRVVPVGQALQMGNHWDGYDVILSLSRSIEFCA